MSKASDSRPVPGESSALSVPLAGADVEPGEPPAPQAEGFVVASHTVLFAISDEVRCDACGDPIPPEDDEGYAIRGAGVYLHARGGDVERESAPLCASCASAIGVAALARWEIEEEEG